MRFSPNGIPSGHEVPATKNSLLSDFYERSTVPALENNLTAHLERTAPFLFLAYVHRLASGASLFDSCHLGTGGCKPLHRLGHFGGLFLPPDRRGCLCHRLDSTRATAACKSTKTQALVLDHCHNSRRTILCR